MWYEPLLERDLLPDVLLRAGIRRLNRMRLRDEAARTDRAAFVDGLKRSPIALHTAAANAQHYEVPAAFFERVLGPRLKYSAGYWADGARDLAQSEEHMLDLTCRRAGLADGQRILDLGCGWGSFTLYAAERFPAARIVAVSNSRSQREFIEARAKARGFPHVRVITSDINDFEAPGPFDRVVSVEMFEHVRNYERLLQRVASWLAPRGELFVHIFCHRRFAYPFEDEGDHDWMARHFFTGGLMPSAGLLGQFQRDLRLREQWEVNGRNYARTCEAWLENMDAHRAELLPLFAQTYGADQARRFWAYWRIFFLACAELFAHEGGEEWFVSHYRFGRGDEG